MRQHIPNFEDLVGKTIEAATVVDLQVLLTFTDGTYAAIVSIEEDGCIHAPELTTAKRDTARQADALGALGIDKGTLVYNEDLKAWKPYQAAEWALNLALTVWEESLGISE